MVNLNSYGATPIITIVIKHAIKETPLLEILTGNFKFNLN